MDEPKARPEQETSKKPYEAPKLTSLGRVEEITRLGSGGQPEGLGGSG